MSVSRLRLSRRLVLKLSKSGSGVWAPFPLSLDQIWKDGRPFTSVKRVKRACISLKVKKITHELDKSGFLRHFSSDFEQFRAILSNFKALLDVSSFALNTHIWGWLELSKSWSNILYARLRDSLRGARANDDTKKFRETGVERPRSSCTAKRTE